MKLPFKKISHHKRFLTLLGIALVTALFIILLFRSSGISGKLFPIIIDHTEQWSKARNTALYFLEIVAILLITFLLLSFPISIIARQLREKEGWDIRIFDVPTGHGEYFGKAIANSLSTELTKIARVLNLDLTENILVTTTVKESSPIAKKKIKDQIPDSKETKLYHARQPVSVRKGLEPIRQKAMLRATSESSISTNFSKSVTLGLGGSTITPIELLTGLQRLWASRDPEFIILGGVQSFGNSIHLVARMEKGDSCVDAWDVSRQCSTEEIDDKVRLLILEEKIPELVEELAFRAYFNNSQSDSSSRKTLQKNPGVANTWKGFNHLIKALEYYNQYIFTQDKGQLKYAKINSCDADEAERGIRLESRDRLLFRLLYSLGNIYLSQGDFENASELFEKAIGRAEGYEIRLDKSDEKVSALELASVYQSLGRLQFMASSFYLAEKSFRRAIEICPENIWHHYYLSLALSQMGWVDEAKDIVEQARNQDIFSKTLELGQELVNTEDRPLFWGKWYSDLGIQFYHDAINICLQEIPRYPDNLGLKHDLHYNLAGLYHDLFIEYGNLEDFDNAVSEYQRVLDLDPKDSAAYDALGAIYLGLAASYIYQDENNLSERINSLLDAAIENLHQSIKLNPVFAEPHYRLGFIYSVRDRREEARSQYIRIIQLNPDFLDAYWALGNIYVDQGETELAISTYEVAKGVAKEKSPYDLRFHNALGYLYSDTEQYDKAIAEFQQVIDLDPTSAFSYVALGDVYHRQGLEEEAVEAYNKAAKLEPENSALHNSLGYSYRNIKHFKESIDEFKKAIKCEPDSAGHYIGLGGVYRRQAAYDQAILSYQKAVSIEPNPLARASLAACYFELGDEEAYKQQIETAQEMSREFVLDEYSQACFEALCKNTDKALEMLQGMLDNKKVTREQVQRDIDFDLIRDDPRFKELVGT